MTCATAVLSLKKEHMHIQHIIPASRPLQKPGIPAQQMQRTGTREQPCDSGAIRNTLAKHAHTHSRKQYHRAHTQPCQHTNYPGHHADTRHPGKADAAHRHTRGLAGAERAKTHSRSTRNTPRNLAVSRGEAEERQR